MAMTPTQEAAYALDYNIARSDLPMAAQLEYDRLPAEGYKTAEGRAGLAAEIAAAKDRFPSTVEARRQILEAIATSNSKYAKPFEKGKMAQVSLFGTESWSDYGAVVLQMAILDTLLSIEEKLEALVPRGDTST